MKIFLNLIILLLLNFNVQAQETVIMKGEAFNGDNKLVYVENHTFIKLPTGEITDIKTTYHNPSGKLIAEVKSTFEIDPFIPNTVFIDHRFNEKQELSYDKNTEMINMKLTDLNSGKVVSNSIKRQDNMVSGQGFHNYILKHYDDKRSDIKFIVLPKLDYYSFYFEQEASKTSGYRRFVLKISNWVLRAIVKEIVVEYKNSNRSLMSFEGLTNIDSDQKKSQTLKIKMSYPGENNDKTSF